MPSLRVPQQVEMAREAEEMCTIPGRSGIHVISSCHQFQRNQGGA